MKIAIDTSILVGLLDPDDLWHTKAVDLVVALNKAEFAGVYFDCVLAETVSVMTRRAFEKNRRDKINFLYNRLQTEFTNDVITWIFPDVPDLYGDVLALMSSSGGELNFNDALIALSCRERNITAIASFDSDFDRVSWLNRLSRPEDIGLIPT